MTVSIRPSDVGAAHEIEVWIDTRFNGDLELPQQPIDDLALPQSGTVKAILADGSEITVIEELPVEKLPAPVQRLFMTGRRST